MNWFVREKDDYMFLYESYYLFSYIIDINKLWPDMQKESWNIQLTKILICSHTLNVTDS
jgi:hypothetical protein